MCERKPSCRPGNNDRERAKDVGKDARHMATRTTQEGRTTTTSMASPAGTSGRDRQEAFASPAASRKRPRSSPGSGGTASGGRSTNPFKAFGHRFRPPPPSPSSRLGVNGGSPPLPPPLPSPPHAGAGSDAKHVGSTPAVPEVSHQAEVPPRAGAASCQPAAGDSSAGVGVDLSQSADEDSDVFAVTPTPLRLRGSAEEITTPAASTPHNGAEGSVSSPVLLVDLSQPAEESAPLPSAAQRAGAAAPIGEGTPDEQGDTLAGALSSTRSCEDNSRPCQEAPLEGAAASAGTDDDDFYSPAMLSVGCPRSGGGGHGDASDAEQGRFDEEGGGGGVGEGEQQGKEEEDEQLASKLCFMVSANTGRVHVYKKADDGRRGGLDDSFDDEEDKKPQHCRLV